MHSEQPSSPADSQMLRKTLVEPLNPGDLGVLLARAGVGKTACLTHIALNHLLRGIPVLHVCIGEIPEKTKVWYHELLKNSVESQSAEEVSRLQRKIEPLRFILAYLHQAFSLEKLEQSLQNLTDQAKFIPSMIVMDGLDFDKTSRHVVESLRNFAQKRGVSLWMSARTHRHISAVNERGIPYPCNETDDLFHSIFLLEALPEAIRVKALKTNGSYGPEIPDVFLNPQTYVLQSA